MDWKSEGQTWPNHELSKFIHCNNMTWHVQQAGEGPQLLLLHGSGATTHSFGKLIPLLSRHFSVTAIDLPGHGFTSRLNGGRPTLDRVSDGITMLLEQLSLKPELIMGHSAGAAIAVNLALRPAIDPAKLISINGAFYPFPGFAGQIFPATAKLLFVNPFMSHLFAFGAASKDRVMRLIESTGSKLDEQGLGYYQRALKSSDHIEGTLAMMANWDLDPVAAKLRALDVPVLQIIGGRDGTIEPSASVKTEKILKHGTRKVFEQYGHLVHEEIPEEVAQMVTDFYNGTLK